MTDEMTPARLAEIKARADAATPGPWEFDELPFRYKVRTPQRHRAAIIVHAGDTVHNIPNYGSPAMGRADAAFIAEARSDVPALIAEVERLTREVEESNRSFLCELDLRAMETRSFSQDKKRLLDQTIRAEARATDAAASTEHALHQLSEMRDRATAAEAKLAEATEIIRQADHVIIWEHDPCLPPDFQERIEAFLSSLDKETTP